MQLSSHSCHLISDTETPKFHYTIAQCAKTNSSPRNTTKKKCANHNESSLGFCLPHRTKHPNNIYKSFSSKNPVFFCLHLEILILFPPMTFCD
jgi:hypothetical protein